MSLQSRLKQSFKDFEQEQEHNVFRKKVKHETFGAVSLDSQTNQSFNMRGVQSFIGSEQIVLEQLQEDNLGENMSVQASSQKFSADFDCNIIDTVGKSSNEGKYALLEQLSSPNESIESFCKVVSSGKEMEL